MTWFLAATAFFMFLGFIFWRAPTGFPISSNFNLSEGKTLIEVSVELKEAELIKSLLWFQFFAIVFGGEKHVVAGDYFFDRPISVFTIAWRITHGWYYQKGIKVMIWEGLNTTEIADRLLERLPSFDSENFKILAKTEEGYLFPDTYYFFPSIKPVEVIRIMKNNFNLRTAFLADELVASGQSLNAVITMASIIEREAGPRDDRSIISGILWKRLKKGMRLQVDVEPGTYKYYGLPEKPIGNPGLDSIEAALRPKESPYFYYIHEDSGNIHYAKTYTEHRANIRKYLR